ncbi:MAG: hypothetical protein HQK99_11665 [Nitrospirae bacterium]|nr:hypothetical protein [Nitrospirota bacterium]
MTLNIRSKLAIFLTLSAMVIFIVFDATSAGVAAKCEYTYYYVSIRDRENYKTERVRGMRMVVYHAYIYDLPNLPLSWVYDIRNNDGHDRNYAIMSAVAKSDNHAIEYKDLENFLILRQPKNKSEKDNIHMRLAILNMTIKESTSLKYFDTDDDEFTVQRIDKCLPEKPKKH